MPAHVGETPLQAADRRAREARSLAQDHETVLDEHDNRLRDLERLVGRLPSALPGDRGSGLAQHFVDLGAKVEALTDKMTETINAIETDRKERSEELVALAKRREPWSRTWWLAIGAAVAVTVGATAQAAFHWLSTLHH
jgi:hypothetical protein